MRILVLGTNYTALKFFELFQKNKENDVFSMFSYCKNYMSFKTNQDILEFCVANDINLVLSTEEKFTTSYLTEELNQNNIAVFSPDIEAIEIVSSKVFAYRFMHKNLIPVPKFFVAEKLSAAIDFIKTTSLPVAIKPDNHSYKEGTLFCQTLKEASEFIEKFFNTGNRKVILQEFVEGKNIEVWTISDGYQAKIIGIAAKYQNNIAYLKPNMISQELQTQIQETIINPTIKALASDECEYVGVLGFDIIIDRNNIPYLLGYNDFFDDLSVEFFTENKIYNWEKIFNSVIEGSIFLENNMPENEYYMMTIRDKEKINFIKAKTKTNLLRIIDEMEYDNKELDEAKILWEM